MLDTIPIDAFRFDPSLQVWTNPSNTQFGYSEGADTERRTLEILRRTKHHSLFSEELQQEIQDWPTQYHFSPGRQNLLRHLKLQKDMSVLELGAGCGAVTRQLGEAAGEVWAVEGGPVRAACIAARTGDLPNVRVFCSDFQTIRIDRQFDVVTLIGVLEYSPLFIAAENPFLQCLRLAHSFLKPTGTLVLAIENQLGLKYFCGAPEDHTGRPYDGIQDFYRHRGVRTCGRAELNRLLAEAGFAGVEFQYPYPDYKLPSWVLTDEALEIEGFDPSAILHRVDSTHDGRKTSHPADERKVRSVLHRNGLLADLSNSFLVLAGASASTTQLTPAGLLAAGYVTERQPWFNTCTRMLVNDQNQIIVEKSRLCAAQPPEPSPLKNVVGSEPYRAGLQLEAVIVDSIQRDGLDAGLAHLRQWVDYLIRVGLRDKDAGDPYASKLKPEFFDCTPPNLIVAGDQLHFIDAEWRYDGDLPLRTHILRYLRQLESREKAVLARYLSARAPFARQLAERLNIPISTSQYREAKQWMHQINRWIVPEYSSSRFARRKQSKKPDTSRWSHWLKIRFRRSADRRLQNPNRHPRLLAN